MRSTIRFVELNYVCTEWIKTTQWKATIHIISNISSCYVILAHKLSLPSQLISGKSLSFYSGSQHFSSWSDILLPPCAHLLVLTSLCRLTLHCAKLAFLLFIKHQSYPWPGTLYSVFSPPNIHIWQVLALQWIFFFLLNPSTYVCTYLSHFSAFFFLIAGLSVLWHIRYLLICLSFTRI